jgi:hypothetical protein
MATIRSIPDEAELVAALKAPGKHRVAFKAWEALNGRRGDLIDKKVYGKLDDSEREELEELQRICGNAVNKAFPLPPADLESLIQLRDRLRAEKAGHGECRG